MPPTLVLSEPLAETDSEAAVVQQLVDLLGEQGWSILVVPELYHVPDDHPAWAQLSALAGPVVLVTALHARPAQWLLRHHGLGGDGVEVISVRETPDAGEVVGRLGAAAPPGTPDTPVGHAAEANSGPDKSVRRTEGRWYPVLDKSRCVECRHCLQFCLFGVYELDDQDRVRVTNPDNCKPGCPACARVCPQSAVIFPLYRRDGAICGVPGQFVELDADGRKLYYGRTGARCPACGQEGDFPAGRRPAADACAECGRAPAAEALPPPDREAARDELDALLDELEHFSRGSS